MLREIIPEEEILKFIKNIKFGSLEIVIHDSRIVQIERTEKIRFQQGSHLDRKS